MNQCETPHSIVLRYRELDPILEPWAERHGLQISTRHRSDETRTMIVVDDAGDTYHLFAIPDYQQPNLTSVGGVLVNRGTKKHTFSRERRQFDFRQSVSFRDVPAALDSAWQRVQEWIAQTGHSWTPISPPNA